MSVSLERHRTRISPSNNAATPEMSPAEPNRKQHPMRGSGTSKVESSPSLDPSQKGKDDKEIEDKKLKEAENKQKLDLEPATGVLAVHIKQATFTALNPDKRFANEDDISVYIRIVAGKQMKVTCVYENVYTPTKVIFDEIKHFLLTIPQKRHHPANMITLEIVVFDKEHPERHRLLSMKQIHLYDIVKKLYAVETYDFWLHNIQKHVAEVDVEISFAYGMFGYGYSNQLENRQKTPKVQLMHSLFYRSEPPITRRDLQDGDEGILTSIPIGHPAFINFSEKVKMGSLGRESDSLKDQHMHRWRGPATPSLLLGRINKRMRKLQKSYSELPNRQRRIQYLRQLIMNTDGGKASLSGEFFDIPKDTHFKKRQHRPMRAPAAVADTDEFAAANQATLDLEAAAHLLTLAPGIQRRGTQHIAASAAGPMRLKTPMSLAARADDKDKEAVEYWHEMLRDKDLPTTKEEFEEQERERIAQMTIPIITVQDEEEEAEEEEMERIAPVEKAGPRRRKITPMPLFKAPKFTTGFSKAIAGGARRLSTISPSSTSVESGRSQQAGSAAPESRILTAITETISHTFLDAAATKIRAFFPDQKQDTHKADHPRVMISPPTPVDSGSDVSGSDEDDIIDEEEDARMLGMASGGQVKSSKLAPDWKPPQRFEISEFWLQ